VFLVGLAAAAAYKESVRGVDGSRARDIAGAMFVHLVVNGAAFFFSRTDGELDRGLGD